MKEPEKNTGRKGKIFWFFILHAALLIYSMTGLFSKNASMHPFLSLPFILFYAGMILILGIYAVLWQQVIKHLPLTTAYVNKAVTVVWGVLLGILFFQERISMTQAFACVVIIAGTVLYVRADLREKERSQNISGDGGMDQGRGNPAQDEKKPGLNSPKYAGKRQDPGLAEHGREGKE